jgi:hypothetical protein
MKGVFAMNIVLLSVSVMLIIANAIWLLKRVEKSRLNDIERFVVVFTAFIATCCACAGFMNNMP